MRKRLLWRGSSRASIYIGRGAMVKKSAVVEHLVSVEQVSRIVSGNITRSIILDYSEIELNKVRLVDSVIVSKSIVKCSKEIYRDVKLIVSDYSIVML